MGVHTLQLICVRDAGQTAQPLNITSWVNKTVMMISAHPDDIECTAGGTIKLLVDQGMCVIVSSVFEFGDDSDYCRIVKIICVGDVYSRQEADWDVLDLIAIRASYISA